AAVVRPVADGDMDESALDALAVAIDLGSERAVLLPGLPQADRIVEDAEAPLARAAVELRHFRPETDRRDVEEQCPAGAAEVDALAPSRGDDRRRLRQVRRDVQRPCQVVCRPERQDTEGLAGLDQLPGKTVEGAVA